MADPFPPLSAYPNPPLGSPEWWMHGLNELLGRMGKGDLPDDAKQEIVRRIRACNDPRIGLADVVNAVIAERAL